MFVVAIRPEDNTVVLSDDPNRTSDRIRVEDMVFSGVPEPEIGSESRFSIKVRYLAPPIPGVLRYMGEGKGEIVLERRLLPGKRCHVRRDHHGKSLIP